MDGMPDFPFCSGIATSSDFSNDKYAEVVGVLQSSQKRFLDREEDFRSSTYRWPSDALNNWSRIWEYPYIAANIERLASQKTPQDGGSRILDFGSGVTFFPFYLASLGFDVVCADIDPICEKDLQRAIKVFEDQQEGSVEFGLIEERRVPVADETIDMVYCISVIEHILDFEYEIAEMHRVLKPGGGLLLTLDIDLRGDHEIGLQSWNRLRECLFDAFTLELPYRALHPADVLTRKSSPADGRSAGFSSLSPLYVVKNLILRHVLRKPAPRLTPPDLAVEGIVLTKR